MKFRRLVNLSSFLFLIWAFLILGSFIILKILFIAYSPINYLQIIFIGVIRVLVGVLMGFLWLLLWRKLAKSYFEWAVKKRGIDLK